MSAILDIFRTWIDGKLPDDHTLWGIPVFWVARMGKGFQIGAGLVVVFDLLTANWLAGWAKRASVRATRRGLLVRHLALSQRIEFDLTETVYYGARPGRNFRRLRLAPPNKVPQGVRLTLDEYRDFHRRAVEEAERVHLRAHYDLGPIAYLTRRADELAAGQLPPDEAAVVGSADAQWAVSANLLVMLAVPLPLLVAVISVARLAPNYLPPALTFLGFAAIAVVLLAREPMLRLLVQSLWHRGQKRLAGSLIKQAEKSPPFLAVKVAALCVFLIGAALDLLAS